MEARVLGIIAIVISATIALLAFLVRQIVLDGFAGRDYSLWVTLFEITAEAFVYIIFLLAFLFLAVAFVKAVAAR